MSQTRTDARTEVGKAGFWPLSPDVAIEVCSTSDDFKETLAKIKWYAKCGSVYSIALDPKSRRVVEIGAAPDGLTVDFDAIIDA